MMMLYCITFGGARDGALGSPHTELELILGTLSNHRWFWKEALPTHTERKTGSSRSQSKSVHVWRVPDAQVSLCHNETMSMLQASPFPKVPPEKGLPKAGRKWEPDLPNSTVLQGEALQVIGGEVLDKMMAAAYGANLFIQNFSLLLLR